MNFGGGYIAAGTQHRARGGRHEGRKEGRREGGRRPADGLLHTSVGRVRYHRKYQVIQLLETKPASSSKRERSRQRTCTRTVTCCWKERSAEQTKRSKMKGVWYSRYHGRKKKVWVYSSVRRASTYLARTSHKNPFRLSVRKETAVW